MKRLLNNDWFAALLFLAAYLATNSYIFGWDDQHLELPLLKRLIDPTLYKGDYYVEGLAGNFSSYLYPILAKSISISQIPAVYLGLFLLSRYIMFYWLYRLWQLISGEKFAAAVAVLAFFLMGRTEEFLYRTFSHQEFSYVFMFGGLYYFYRERFILAALLLGIGANFHAIYCLFPMLYMLTYLIFCHSRSSPSGTASRSGNPKSKLLLVIKTGVTFAIFALPFLLWQIPHSLAPKANIPVAEWFPLYERSCPQNFLFNGVPWQQAVSNLTFVLVRIEPYVFLLILYAVLCVFEPRLRSDRKTRALVIVAYVLIVFSIIFSYAYPNRLVIDLNLLRNEQFVRLLLMGYISVFACRVAREGRPWQVLLAALFFFSVGFGSLPFLLFKIKKYAFIPLVLAALFFVLLCKPHMLWLRRAFIILPLAATFVSFALYHYQYVQLKTRGLGLWQFYRSWVDMQNYARIHTSKDALILVPYDTDTGGFRIFSERKILVCQRDCGIIGFNYNAAVEWDKRRQDVKEFKFMTGKNILPALKNAVTKYKVDYVVFMNYYQPEGMIPFLKKLYQNEVLALYEVAH